MDTLSPVVFLVIVAIASAAAGGLLAGLIFMLTGVGSGGGKAKRRPSPSPQPGAPPSPDERELLRVSRMKKGNLAVFVQGQPYRHMQEVTDPQIGLETADAVNAVMGFAKGLLPATQQPAATEPAPKSSVDEVAFLERLRQSDLFPAGKPAVPPRRSSKPEPLRTPAEEINDLIQRRLERWPDLLEEKVRLSTREDGSLCIHVGLRTFQAVDDIPDSQARALVKDAIREWESVQRRG